MKKYYFAFCTVFILLASLFIMTPAFAAEKSEVQLVYDLGIVKKSDGFGLIPESFSRGEFAKTLNMLDANKGEQFSEESKKNMVCATDIEGDINEQHISTMLAFGYMDVNENGEFRPGASVTKDVAAKSIIRALGYDVIAELNGGESSDYDALAIKLGLYKGVKINNPDALSVDEVAGMIANCMSIRFFTDSQINLGDTCFYTLWSITKYQGRVLANSKIGLAVQNTSPNHVNIGGCNYYTNLLIDDELIGSIVTYYTINGTYGEEVVSIFVNKAGNTVTLSSSDIDKITDKGDYLEITSVDKDKIRMTKKGIVLVNGVAKSPKKSLFDIFKSGTVTFIDSDGNNEYETANMSLFVTMIIDGVNVENKTIGTRFERNIINLDDIDNCEIYINNKVASVADLKNNMVISVCCDSYTQQDSAIIYDFSKANFIQIYASERKRSGYVDSMTDEYIYVDEIKEKLSSSYEDMVEKKYISAIKLGDRVVLYYDSLGEVAYYEIDTSENEYNYGYIIEAATYRKLGKVTLEMKLLAADGKIYIYSVDEKFVLDGKRVKTDGVVYTVNETDDVDLSKRQVIRYGLSDGVVNKIDTAVCRRNVEDNLSSLNVELPFDPYVEDNTKYKVVGSSYNRRYRLAATTVVFVDGADITDTDPNEKLFTVLSGSRMSNGNFYFAGYDMDEFHVLGCAVRYDGYGGESVSTKSKFDQQQKIQVIESIWNVINEDGDEGWKITVAGDNQKADYMVFPDRLKLYNVPDSSWGDDYLVLEKLDETKLTDYLSTGDIIRFSVDASNNIDYIEKLFDFTPNMSLKEIPYQGGQTCGYVNVEKLFGNLVLYTQSEDADAEEYVFSNYTVNNTKVILYDVETEEANVVNISEIPSAATGTLVKAFVRVYNYERALDQVFYVFN